MGLFDWLTDGLGTVGGLGGSDPSPPSPPPMPPVQQTGPDAPSLPGPPTPPPGMTAMGDQTGMGAPPPQPPAITPAAAGDSLPPDPSQSDLGIGASGTMPPPVPLPMPRPPGANAPSNPTPIDNLPSIGPGQPGPPTSLAPPPPGSVPQAPTAPPTIAGQTALGRALGIDPNSNTFKTMMGGLGKGLSAVPANAHAPGLAAFAGSAGASITGGEDAKKQITDAQSKYLSQAIEAAKAGDQHALSLAQTRLALAKAANEESGKSEQTGINTPDAKYLTAVQRTNADPRLALLRDQVRAGTAGKDPDAQTKQMGDLRNQILQEHLQAMGLSSKQAGTVAKKPGMSEDNPLIAKSQADIAKAQAGMVIKIPKGTTIIDPATGQPKTLTEDTIMRKKAVATPNAAPPPPQQPAPSPAPAGGAPSAPPQPPPVPSAPTKTPAADDEEED